MNLHRLFSVDTSNDGRKVDYSWSIIDRDCSLIDYAKSVNSFSMLSKEYQDVAMQYLSGCFLPTEAEILQGFITRVLKNECLSQEVRLPLTWSELRQAAVELEAPILEYKTEDESLPFRVGYRTAHQVQEGIEYVRRVISMIRPEIAIGEDELRWSVEALFANGRQVTRCKTLQAREQAWDVDMASRRAKQEIRSELQGFVKTLFAKGYRLDDVSSFFRPSLRLSSTGSLNIIETDYDEEPF
jgi:hypothetical protein